MDGGRLLLRNLDGISGDIFYRNGSGADFTTVTNEWLDANIRSKGPLGKLYPQFAYIMEGDTPTFLGLIVNGLNAYRRPDWGGWGGWPLPVSHALSMEQEQPYDMICMDIMMPEMDGRQAMRRIRAIEEDHGTLSTLGVKVIMTTTVEDVKEVILCFQELCDAYLMKPIDLAELVEQMKRY